MLHLTPTSSDSTSPQIFEDTMHNVIKSTEDIINDDFEKFRISDLSFPDYSRPPYSGISPSNVAGSIERKPFDVLIQYPGFSNLHMSSSNKRIFNENQPRIQTQEQNYSKDSANLNMRYPDNKIQKIASDTMSNYAKMIPVPILKLNIMGPPEYDLNEKSIMNLFSRFGAISNITLGQHRSAYIVFEDASSALGAQKALNKYCLKDLNLVLYVSFCSEIEGDANPKPELNLGKMLRQNSNNGSDKENNSLTMNTGKKSIYTFAQDAQFIPNTTTKFTCKYEIQIENEKEFRVAQKIIGSRGYNMKKIIEICQSQVKNPSIIYKNDFLKLRLRGKGSGFKEGYDQKESSEPIHLCVSSRYNDVFETACKLVEDLLIYVYREYETFCKVNNRKGSFPLAIKKSETYSADRQTPDGYGDPFAASPNNFSAYSPSSNGQMFFGNENCPNGNMPIPSPRNNFRGGNQYRQFGQERNMNCYVENGQQGGYKVFQGIGNKMSFY